MINKKIWVFFVITAMFFTQLAPVSLAESGFFGHIEKNEQINKDNEKIFTGEVEELKTKHVIKMTVSQVISSGYSQEGDEFFAEVTENVAGDKGVLIQAGSIAHGQIHVLQDAKRLGRNGYVMANFDYIITPDGRQIPIEGGLTTKENTAVGTGKVIAQDIGYTALGGVIGGFAALNFFGIEAAIASQGYTLAGGAAVGGAVGLAMGLARKGKEVHIEPGEQLTIKILSGLQLPVLSEEAFKQKEHFLDGLKVNINNVTVGADPFGEKKAVTLSLGITNHSQKTFSAFDIALENDYKAVFYPSPFGESDLWFKAIEPGDRVVGKITFIVDDTKRKHWLVFYDKSHKSQLAKISVDNVVFNIEKAKKDKKTKKTKKNK